MTSPPLRILVADDQPTIRSLVQDALLREGHRVETAADGEQVVTRFSSAAYDLLITDVNMPGTNGIQAAVQIRSLAPQVAVIFMSSRGTHELALFADIMRFGDARFLQKPFGLDELLSAVRGCAARRCV